MIDIPCILFAGGKSSRMGEDKALLPFAGFATLTQYQLHRLSKIFTSVYISCREKSKFDFEANFIEDAKESDVYAPTTGFIAAFEALGVERFFVVSVDAPFVDAEIFLKLYDADKEEFDATIAKSPYGMEPLCGIYHRSLEKKFVAMQKSNNHRLGSLLKNSKTHFLSFDTQEKFLNLNNPDEYKEALEKILINY